MDRNTALESLYENLQIKDSIKRNIINLNETQIDEILMSESLLPIEEEVIEELFGKTRAKLAGGLAKAGAKVGNVAKRVGTKVGNVAQKAGAVAGNIGELGKEMGSKVAGNPQQGDYVNPADVGNAQANTVDPQVAQQQAQLTSLMKGIVGSINNMEKIGLDDASLQNIDPDIAQSIINGKKWFGDAVNKINSLSQGSQQQAAPQQQQAQAPQQGAARQSSLSQGTSA